MGRDWALGLFGKRSGPDNYEMGRLIARGGMSAVYEGRRKSDGLQVAIKIITPEFTQLAAQLEEIFDRGSEGEVALNLRHANVVRTYEFGHKGREYFIIMEYVDGLNLKQMIDQGDPRWSKNRLKISIQIGRGLAYIHKNGLVHRDFCPKNILLAPDDTPKIIDFGLAVPEQVRQKWHWDRSGTAAYMAPEQVRGQRVDVRTDVYALGVSIFEILTGERPFPDDADRMRKMAVHLNVQPASLRTHIPNIPIPLDHILTRSMAKDADERYPTVEAMLREFQSVAVTYYGADLRLPVK